MISAEDFCAELDHRGFALATGVPCGWLRGPLARLAARPGHYVPAVNEGAALAIAAGAELAGRRTAVLIQNSGLGNLINPLSSLVLPYRIPVTVFMTLRGWPDPDGDEPQHALTGVSTQPILDQHGVPHWVLTDRAGHLREVMDRADEARSRREPSFVLLPAGLLGTDGAAPGAAPGATGAEFGLAEAMAVVAPALSDSLAFATTGRICRALYAAGHRPENFYMQGSMGHVLALGIGACVARPDRRVVVLDGDGAALMHLGTMATAGAVGPSNLLHVIFDNGTYDSTGGQPAPGPADWTVPAAGLGYRRTVVCDGAEELRAALGPSLGAPSSGEAGPVLVVVRTAPGSPPLPRPSDVFGLPEMAREFRSAAEKVPARTGGEGRAL